MSKASFIRNKLNEEYATSCGEEITCKRCHRSYPEILENKKPVSCCPFCPWLTLVNESSLDESEINPREAASVSETHLDELGCGRNCDLANVAYDVTCNCECLRIPAAVARDLNEDITVPLIVMSDFEDKRNNNERWYSPVFCTEKGYHFRLRVDANGWCGTGGAVAVVVSIVKGDYDDQLQWPFEGVITVHILNHTGNSEDSIVKDFIFSSGGYECQRVMDETQPEYGCWCDQFIKYESLYYSEINSTQYIKGDCLFFLVTYESLLLATC